MSGPAKILPMTVAEFLNWDDGTDVRHELIDGQIVAMNPPADPHGTIAGNAWGEIDRRLERRPPCRGVVEAGVWIDNDNYYVANVTATCAPPSGDTMVREPFLIVEVISASNERIKFGLKVQAYIGLPWVQEVWLIDSRKHWVQQWRRGGEDRWIVTLPLTGSAGFESPTLGDRIELDRLYRNTGL